MGTIWVNSDHPLIGIIQGFIRTEDTRDGGSCDMLAWDTDGKATCLIHKYLGLGAKPQVCQEYPEEGELCQKQEKNLTKD